jgi:GMP synthase-like glutamine amidotransferase
VSLKERCQNYFIGKNKRSCAITCMAVRFTDYFVTQFHPEADPVSFVSHLRNKEAKEKIKA